MEISYLYQSIEGKGEIARHEQFLLYCQCFGKALEFAFQIVSLKIRRP